jgi:iron complex transport system substrate-binding protein
LIGLLHGLDRNAMRIASLLSSSTEMLYALGVGENVVAVSHECDFPPPVRHRPRVTRSYIAAEASSGEIDAQVRELLEQGRPLYELDCALLARLRPDLIVTQAQCDVCAVRYADVLEAVARTPALRNARVVALNPQSLDDVLADIGRLGEAAGCIDAAQSYVDRLRARIEAIASRTRRLAPSERPRVACIEWVEPLMIAGNWVPQLIELAGGEQTLAAPQEHSAYVSWEAVRQFDPQVVVVAPCGFDLQRTLAESPPLADQDGWRDVTAVHAGRVWAVDGNAYFNRSGPRLVDTLEILAHLLHPALFEMPSSAADAAAPILVE